MQDNRVKAFRQRLVRAGFTDISIFADGNDQYTVYATDRFGLKYRECMSVIRMESLPRITWFHEDSKINSSI